MRHTEWEVRTEEYRGVWRATLTSAKGIAYGSGNTEEEAIDEALEQVNSGNVLKAGRA